MTAVTCALAADLLAFLLSHSATQTTEQLKYPIEITSCIGGDICLAGQERSNLECADTPEMPV